MSAHDCCCPIDGVRPGALRDLEEMGLHSLDSIEDRGIAGNQRIKLITLRKDAIRIEISMIITEQLLRGCLELWVLRDKVQILGRRNRGDRTSRAAVYDHYAQDVTIIR